MNGAGAGLKSVLYLTVGTGIGGGVMKSGLLLSKVKKELVERIADYVEIPPIDKYVGLPALGDDTGITGGLLLAIQEYEKVG
ncbi:hypothetical protein [Paenibacillus polymyxa]|uniref:hypothetical protein n=1 Tax=Paenibacillus polymyxa TaxID=1406 RepID=UPI0037C6B917